MTNDGITTVGFCLLYSSITIGIDIPGGKRFNLLRIIKLIDQKKYTLKEILGRLVPAPELSGKQPHQYDLYFDWKQNKVYSWEVVSTGILWTEFDINEIIAMMKQTGEL